MNTHEEINNRMLKDTILFLISATPEELKHIFHKAADCGFIQDIKDIVDEVNQEYLTARGRS